MNNLLTPGSKYLLDGVIEVVVLKPSTRANSSYNIEHPGRSIETVARERLTPLSLVSAIKS